MTPETAQKLEAFFSRFARGARPLLLLDYDGTLAPFRVDRFKARPWAGVRELLQKIQNQGSTRIRVISGRPAREVAQLLALEPVPETWGLHGSQRLHSDGTCEQEQLPAETQARLNTLRELLRRDSFGGLFEDKPNAAVMHWRGASPQRAAEIEACTRELFEPLAQIEGLTLLKFEAGLELRAGLDKGGAVSAILREASAGAPLEDPAAYLGDDFTDEAAFRAVDSSPGPHLSVLVRRQWRETAADLWLHPPRELLAFLNRWLHAVQPAEKLPHL